MRIKEIGFSRDTITVFTDEDRGYQGYRDFEIAPSEIKAAIAFVQEAENSADFQLQLDRLVTAQRLFREAFALLKELR